MGNPEHDVVDATSKPDGSEVSIDFEKRYKDTQGAYTKSQQALKAAQAKLEILEQLTTPKVELDEATKTELDGLKFSNPDEWRNRLNQLETEAQLKHKQTLTEAEKTVTRQMELENRASILADFQKRHPNLALTDETINYDVPPRITAKLERGEVSFEQFLEEVTNYLQAPKVIGDGNRTISQPNLGYVGGDTTPTADSTKKSIAQDYSDMVF